MLLYYSFFVIGAFSLYLYNIHLIKYIVPARRTNYHLHCYISLNIYKYTYNIQNNCDVERRTHIVAKDTGVNARIIYFARAGAEPLKIHRLHIVIEMSVLQRIEIYQLCSPFRKKLIL